MARMVSMSSSLSFGSRALTPSRLANIAFGPSPSFHALALGWAVVSCIVFGVLSLLSPTYGGSVVQNLSRFDHVFSRICDRYFSSRFREHRERNENAFHNIHYANQICAVSHGCVTRACAPCAALCARASPHRSRALLVLALCSWLWCSTL